MIAAAAAVAAVLARPRAGGRVGSRGPLHASYDRLRTAAAR